LPLYHLAVQASLFSTLEAHDITYQPPPSAQKEEELRAKPIYLKIKEIGLLFFLATE